MTFAKTYIGGVPMYVVQPFYPGRKTPTKSYNTLVFTNKAFQAWKNALSVVALVSTAFAILVSGRQWKALLLVSTTLCLAGIYACSSAIGLNTTNFIRIHRRL